MVWPSKNAKRNVLFASPPMLVKYRAGRTSQLVIHGSFPFMYVCNAQFGSSIGTRTDRLQGAVGSAFMGPCGCVLLLRLREIRCGFQGVPDAQRIVLPILRADDVQVNTPCRLSGRTGRCHIEVRPAWITLRHEEAVPIVRIGPVGPDAVVVIVVGIGVSHDSVVDK